MPTCSAFGCTNRSGRKRTPGITFHKFPKNEMLSRLWIMAVRRKNWVPTKHSRICSAHFSEDVIDRTLNNVLLKNNAVPTIFEALPNNLQLSENFKKLMAAQSSADSPTVLNYIQEVTKNNEYEKLRNIDEVSHCGETTSSDCEKEVTELSHTIHLKNKEIKVLQQKLRRYKRRVENLNSQTQNLDGNEITNDHAIYCSFYEHK